ncbi:MAG: aldehyde dehydrogenase family protein [Thermomicrobiales bacterium]
MPHPEHTDRAALDAAIATLRAHKDAWAHLPVAAKITYLETMHQRTGAVAARWVAAAAHAKGLPPDSPLVGEEWLSGPWGLLHNLDRLIASLRAVARRRTPRLRRGSLHTRPDGQVIAEVFPQTAADRLLFSGITAEVWMEPGVTEATLPGTMAAWYRQAAPAGKVALVLGAGNIAAIAPLDLLHKLIAEGQVCLLKLNPVNDYLGPILAEIFAPLIADGYVYLAYGGATVGAYLCAHDGIDEIHITGSARTHDAIVYGPGPAGAERKRRDEPLITRRVTSELGNASPTIVVPGPWTTADLCHQAEHLATQKFHNAGFNCIASQVLVTPADWPQERPLLDALRAMSRALPARPDYYPGSTDRLAALVARYPQAESLGPGRAFIPNLDPSRADEACFTAEIFGGVLAQTSLPGRDPAAYLDRAVRFCNDALHGTLGVNILIHPATRRELGPAFEDAIAALRYGCIAINAWTGVGFLLATATWGAHPGHTRADIGSGTGLVHNALLFSRAQKSVIRAPFRPFPRALAGGEATVLPKPPWFVTHRRAAEVAARLVAFERDHSPRHLPGLLAAALRG